MRQKKIVKKKELSGIPKNFKEPTQSNAKVTKENGTKMVPPPFAQSCFLEALLIRQVDVELKNWFVLNNYKSLSRNT